LTMETQAQAMSSMPRREPWNKGKLIGQKPPLRPKHVWSIRTRLQMEGRTRDLAMFNLAIDSKLRGCDVVALRVEDVAPSGYAVDRATVRQKKTGQPVRFELSEQTRQAVDDHIRISRNKAGEFLFTGRGRELHRERRSRPAHFRNALATANEADVDLSADRKPSCRPAAARSSEDREHRPVSRNRGRRRTRYSRAGGRLNSRGKADGLCPIPMVGVVPIADKGEANH